MGSHPKTSYLHSQMLHIYYDKISRLHIMRQLVPKVVDNPLEEVTHSKTMQMTNSWSTEVKME